MDNVTLHTHFSPNQRIRHWNGLSRYVLIILICLFKVDTGAQINVIAKNALDLLDPRPVLLQHKVKLQSYQGQSIPSLGLCTVDIHCSKGNIPALFAIVPQGYPSVLGLSTAIKMGILDIPEGDKFTEHSLQVNSILSTSTFGKDISHDTSGVNTDHNPQLHSIANTDFCSSGFGKDILRDVTEGV